MLPIVFSPCIANLRKNQEQSYRGDDDFFFFYVFTTFFAKNVVKTKFETYLLCYRETLMFADF